MAWPSSSSSSSYYCTHLALLVVLSSTSLFFLYKSLHLRRRRSHHLLTPPPNPNPKPIKLLFASTTGTSKTLATRLASLLSSSNLPVDLVNAADFEPEDLTTETLVLFVISTWENGKPPTNATFLSNWLADSAADFRAGSLLLARCRFAVFGVGSGVYGASFNAAARDFSKWMRALGAVELAPVLEGDVDMGDLDEVFEKWCGKIVKLVKGAEVMDGEKEVSDLFDVLEEDGFSEEEEEEEEEVGEIENGEIDMEDIAGKGPVRKKVGGGEVVVNADGEKNGVVREMVTPIIRKSLEKQVRIIRVTVECY